MDWTAAISLQFNPLSPFLHSCRGLTLPLNISGSPSLPPVIHYPSRFVFKSIIFIMPYFHLKAFSSSSLAEEVQVPYHSVSILLIKLPILFHRLLPTPWTPNTPEYMLSAPTLPDLCWCCSLHLELSSPYISTHSNLTCLSSPSLNTSSTAPATDLPLQIPWPQAANIASFTGPSWHISVLSSIWSRKEHRLLSQTGLDIL